MPTRSFLLFSALLASLAACGPTMPPRHRQYILERAPADLQCERDRIRIHERKTPGFYSAYGCGAKAAYRVTCNERSECQAELVEVPVPIRPDPDEGEK